MATSKGAGNKAKLQNIVTPDDPAYGAKGDDSTDDSTAMQAAATAAAGGVLKLAAGKTYRVANVSIPANTCVDMNGATVKLKVLATTVGSAIFAAGGNNVFIYGGGTFDGNKSNQPADGFSDSYNGGTNGKGRSYRAAITADALTDIKVAGCHFKNTFGAGIATRNCDRVSVYNNTCDSLNFELAYLTTTVSSHTDYLVQNNRGTNFASGDGSVNANAVIITQADRVNISGNVFFNCERSHIKVEGGNYIAISNNVCRTNTVANFPAITVQQNNANVVAIVGNVISNVGAGFILSSPVLTSVTVTGNTVDTTTGSSTAGYGIQFSNSSSCNDVVVSGNTFRNLKGIGCYLTTTISRAKVVGNSFHGQGASNQQALILGGTGTSDSVTIENNLMVNFCQTAVDDGVVSNSSISGGTYTNFVFRGNTVLSGSSTNRAVFLAYSNNSIAGVFENNVVDGTCVGTHSGLKNGLNVVSGANAMGAATMPGAYVGGAGVLFMGAGAPNNANGSNGDFYFRSDGTQGGNTVIYHKEAAAWVALVTT